MKKIVLLILIISTNAFSYSENPMQMIENKIGNCDCLIRSYEKLKACNKADLASWISF